MGGTASVRCATLGIGLRSRGKIDSASRAAAIGSISTGKFDSVSRAAAIRISREGVLTDERDERGGFIGFMMIV